MAKSHDPQTADKADADPADKTAADAPGVLDELPATGQVGPDEEPVNVQEFSLVPDPHDYLVPDPPKLTKGQVEGLAREALEAYWYGVRVREDAGGRRWDFRRLAEDGRWALVIRVQIGPLLLGKSGISLDRVPSAEGERELLALVERMAVSIGEAQTAAVAEQKKRAKGV
jgi:hypothetical protein